MKLTATLTALIASIAIITTATAATSSNGSTQFAANRLKTIKHRVHSENCEQKRKEIMNRCRYHHKMSRSFCEKQDKKNAAVCANLRQKKADYEAKQRQNAANRKAADENFNQCIASSKCDLIKDNEAATKACYEHCHKAAGY